MKKLLSLIALVCCIAVGSHAQPLAVGGSFTKSQPPVFYTTLDTVNNTGTKTYSAVVLNRFQSVTLQVNMSYISGTATGVTVKYYGAVCTASGTPQYVLLYTDTMTNTSTPYSHVITGNPYTHYQIVVTGLGTQSTSYQAFVLLR